MTQTAGTRGTIHLANTDGAPTCGADVKRKVSRFVSMTTCHKCKRAAQ